MKKIVCELCEGMQFDKVDGRFVCKGCGTSYSAEEARGMMVEVEGEIPVATGVPVVPTAMPQNNQNQQQLENFLLLASTAYDADNYQEAENYCNKAIETDATAYKAWFLKARAVGWSSKMDNNRFEEAAHSFCRAIDFAPAEEKEKIKDDAVEELRRLGLAVIATRKSRYVKWPDSEELAGFKHDRKVLIDALTVLLQHGNAVNMPDGYLDEIAVIMTDAASGAFDSVRREYNGNNHPTSNDFSKTMNAVDNCIALMDDAIDASDEDDESDIPRYEAKINMRNFVINMTAYENYSSRFRTWQLTDKAKEASRALNKLDAIFLTGKRATFNAEKEKERKILEEAKQKRIDAYWEEHADEKANLETERKEIEEKIGELRKELSEQNEKIRTEKNESKEKTPSELELEQTKDKIDGLYTKKASLSGMFVGKQKKEIENEIAILEARVSSLSEKAKSERIAVTLEKREKTAPLRTRVDELNKQIAELQSRVSEIDARFSEDPGEDQE